MHPMSDRPSSINLAPNPSRRRDKPQLSCNLCRRRKLKCDRGEPCDTCVRRGISLSCTYTRVAPNAIERLERSSLYPAPSMKVQDRIGELENLVISLMGTLNAATPIDQQLAENIPTPGSRGVPLPATKHGMPGTVPQQPLSQLSESFGRISLENAEITYVEGTHWTSLLDGITELKDYFEDDNKSTERHQTAPELPEVPFDGPELLFGGYKSVTKQEILAAIPPRSMVDRLIATCFIVMDAAPMIIHRPTFLNEYEKFWDNPMDTPVMWIGLLFTVMCIGTLYLQLSQTESGQGIYPQPGSDPRRLIQSYREKIIQCLILGRYTKAVPYTIETLLLYFHIEIIRSQDTQAGLWILLGIIIRLALRMGYHRDASHFPRLSAFHGEMRRRVWAMIMEIDVYASAQIGLPRMIRESHSDTAEPCNLLDEDFDENTPDLPHPKPDTTQTLVQYFTSKNRIIFIFGAVTDLTTSTVPKSYADVIVLDQRLQDTYKTIPQWLHMRPMSKSIMDSTEVITRRIYVDLSYHKTRCVLHRTYLLQGRTDKRYSYSRTVCIESALHLLDCQLMLDQETQPGGRLYQDRYKITSIVKNEFLHAVTTLCLDLDYDIKDKLSHSEFRKDILGPDTSDRVIKALNDSYWIWIRSCDTSREAQKAAAALRVVLGKVQKMNRSAERGGETLSNAPSTSSDSFSFSIDPSFLLAGKTPSQLGAAPVSSGSSVSMSDFLESDNTGTIDSFSGMEAELFDWEAWDTGYQTLTVDDNILERLRNTQEWNNL